MSILKLLGTMFCRFKIIFNFFLLVRVNGLDTYCPDLEKFLANRNCTMCIELVRISFQPLTVFTVAQPQVTEHTLSHCKNYIVGSPETLNIRKEN